MNVSELSYTANLRINDGNYIFTYRLFYINYEKTLLNIFSCYFNIVKTFIKINEDNT